jgi:hypothetical protein
LRREEHTSTLHRHTAIHGQIRSDRTCAGPGSFYNVLVGGMFHQLLGYFDILVKWPTLSLFNVHILFYVYVYFLTYITRLVIGLFGLIGIGGVSAAPFTGHLIDHMVPWCSTLITSFGLLCSAAIQTGASGINIGAVVVGCIFADLFRQMQQISITSSVLGIEPSASARMNAVLIFFVSSTSFSLLSL